MGVPDYVPSEIVDGKVTVMPNAFGDFGEGLLNVSKLKTGKVTICRLGYCGDAYALHITTGTARAPGQMGRSRVGAAGASTAQSRNRL
jgi:hypothetical protein